ncbi:ATP-binding protein [Nonomuraea sp. NPDC050556]|uniref:ATP-binding protein n=1 Tax=Nonomuraea sp. NPDC050556 TaxID=3364369 RepID=UPI0037AF4544
MTTFIGRDREVADVRRLLDESRLVTLTGVGGVGKTRLALRVAELRGGHSALADLSALRDPVLLPGHVAAALDLHDQSARPQLDALTQALGERRALLVLDSCEHLTDQCAMLAEVLLSACPRLRILATGRQALDTPGERVYQVPPLPLPGPAAGSSDATALLLDRAPGLKASEASAPAIAQICHRLDGIPLALELAAIQLATMSPERLLSALDDRFQLLRGHARTGLPRHRTLRTAIGWSHELCDPSERLLWARLSVFAGGFDQAAAEYVCADEHLAAGEIDVLLSRLVSRSLLISEGERFRMLGTIAEFGMEWLLALGEEQGIRRRHRDFYLRRARRGEDAWSGRAQPEWHGRLTRDLANLRAALDYSLDTEGEQAAGLTLAATLWYFWAACGHMREGRHYLDRALEAVPTPGSARTKALWVCGWIAAMQGDLPHAVAMASVCRTAAEEQLDESAGAYALQVAGAAAFFSGDIETAITQFSDSTAYHRANGELNPGLLLGLPQLGMALILTGDLPRARMVLEECLGVCDEAGELWARSYACYVLGVLEWASGSLDVAWSQARVALRIKRLFDDVTGGVLCLELLAWIAAGRGDLAQAARLLGAAQGIWRTFGLPLFGSPFYGAEHAACERAAREGLGDAEYDRLCGEGAGLGYADATAYCLGEWRGPTAWATATASGPPG